MASVAAFFDGSRLMLARQLAGLRKNALAEAIGKSPTAIAAFENGTKRPSASTVAELAIVLGVDPQFFVVGARPAYEGSSPPHFRSLRSTTQLVRDQAYAYGLLTNEVASALERHVEFPPVDMPTIPVDPDEPEQSDTPEEAARLLRKQWDLPAGPVDHLVRIAEHHGILVVFSPIATASVDAYSFQSERRPIVVLNPLKLDYFRQRFDLAHEVGHVIIHADAEPGSRVVEEQANRFAAEFLMPGDELRPLLPRRADWQTFGRLKEQWKVSLQALLFRARRLGVMSDVTYRNAMTTLSASGWRRREPGPMPAAEQPSLLPKAVELLGSARIDDIALAQQCNVPPNLFRRITSRTPEPATALDPNQLDLEAVAQPNNVVSLLRR